MLPPFEINISGSAPDCMQRCTLSHTQLECYGIAYNFIIRLRMRLYRDSLNKGISLVPNALSPIILKG